MDLLNQQFGEPLDRVHALANLGALEVVPAVQAGAQHKVPAEQGAGALENAEDLALGLVLDRKLGHGG